MKDLLKEEGGDIMVKNDDLVIGFSDQQHRADLLVIEKGELKHAPGVGVGVQSFLESEDEAGLLREIAVQYAADGMDVKRVKTFEGKIYVEAAYK